jgi:predicted nuclease of predicted toxin-antitoxin system
VKVLLDENLPLRWKDFLATVGIQSKHWIDVGQPGDPDELILDYARKNHFLILTQDLDFTRMLAHYGNRLPSVIQLRVDSPLPELIGNTVLAVLNNHQEKLAAGCLVSVDLKRKRLRTLPIHKVTSDE